MTQILCKDPRTVGAGGASELELAKQLSEFGKKETGLDQYAIAKFAEALEVSSPHHLPLRPETGGKTVGVHGACTRLMAPSLIVQHTMT